MAVTSKIVLSRWAMADTLPTNEHWFVNYLIRKNKNIWWSGDLFARRGGAEGGEVVLGLVAKTEDLGGEAGEGWWWWSLWWRSWWWSYSRSLPRQRTSGARQNIFLTLEPSCDFGFCIKCDVADRQWSCPKEIGCSMQILCQGRRSTPGGRPVSAR